MPRKAMFTTDMINQAKRLISDSAIPRDALMALATLVPAIAGATIAQTSSILGTGTATVARLQAKFRNQVRCASSATKRIVGTWGGRRRQTLSIDEERDFLAPWSEQAKIGGVLTVPPIRQSLEEKIGRRVNISTVYRILGRHGWRKVEPDTHHPKADAQAQETFKKTSTSPSARWCPGPEEDPCG
jgi:transposase